MKKERVRIGWLQFVLLGCFFILANGELYAATITGRISNSGGDGLNNVCVNAHGTDCGGDWVAGGGTDANGDYTIDIADGTYFINTDVTCGGSQESLYIDKNYNTTGGTTNCDNAEGVLAGSDNINLTLEQGGRISGTLRDTGGTPLTGIDFVGVTIFQGSCNDLQWVGYGPVDPATGEYSTSGIAPGDYILQTYMQGTQYIDEYWASGGSVRDCADAGTVTVEVGQTNSGNDFNLEQGGSISGSVLDSQGNVLSGDGWKSVSVYQGSCDNLQQVTYGPIDATSGVYTLSGLASGEYIVQTYVPGTSYIDEFWASEASVRNCADAEPVIVTAGQTRSNTNFQLDQGGKISGTVYQADGITPVTVLSICVDVYDNDPCGGDLNRVGGGCTNQADGTYETTGLDAGTYYLYTNTFDSGYIDEYWASPASTQDCANTMQVTVTAGQTNSGKDFQLDMGGTISGTVYDELTGDPITGQTDIQIRFYTGDPCGDTDFKGEMYIENDGTFRATGVKDGSWFVRTWTDRNAYIPEWRTATSSAVSCSEASLVVMNSGVDVTNVDFHLEKGARISGHVYERDGKTPIDSERELRVQVFQGTPCDNPTWFTSAVEFAPDGSYQTGGLPTGTFYLRFKESGTDTSDDVHQREWWADPLSTPLCSGAQAVIVAGTTDIENKNFQVDKTGKFPWAIFLPAILIQNAK